MIQHYILYIPGLGDGYDQFRARALRRWTVFGVNAELLPMVWYDGQPYEQKYQRIHERITELIASGARVSLVGESAGASMALNIFASHPNIERLVLVAGVAASSTPVARATLAKGPAFAVSRQNLAVTLPQLSAERRRDIHTVSAFIDGIVTAKSSTITGAKNHRLPTIGHLFTIALCLTLCSGYIVRLAKK